MNQKLVLVLVVLLLLVLVLVVAPVPLDFCTYSIFQPTKASP